MDFLVVLLILFIGMGCIFIIVGFANQNKEPETLDMYDLVDEVEGMSNLLMEEMEGKYQELMFLYQLIDDKKEELQGADLNSSFSPPKSAKELSKKVFFTIDDNQRPSFKHPLLGDILMLKKEDMPTQDIAKKLDIGYGEVQMILDLYTMTTPKNNQNRKAE